MNEEEIRQKFKVRIETIIHNIDREINERESKKKSLNEDLDNIKNGKGKIIDEITIFNGIEIFNEPHTNDSNPTSAPLGKAFFGTLRYWDYLPKNYGWITCNKNKKLFTDEIKDIEQLLSKDEINKLKSNCEVVFQAHEEWLKKQKK